MSTKLRKEQETEEEYGRQAAGPSSPRGTVDIFRARILEVELWQIKDVLVSHSIPKRKAFLV